MPRKIGSSTYIFDNVVSILSTASVVGKKEGEGPLSKEFDIIYADEMLGETSFEKAESRLQCTAVELAIQKAGLLSSDIDMIFAGDLLNQCTASAYGLRSLNIPYLGQYGACSTMAQTLAMSSIMVDSKTVEHAVAVTSSHFCCAERQFRSPLEYGSIRTPTSQWTVTGSGAVVLSANKGFPQIVATTIGKINDLGVKDANNMGAAMAPAAADTIKTFFNDTKTSPSDYDYIFTGDLGVTGSNLLYELLLKENISITKNHRDCGMMIFDIEKQDVNAGGSGCGCSASVFCSYIYDRLKKGVFKKILFCATGALMSPTTTLQGESIPSIAHIIEVIAPN